MPRPAHRKSPLPPGSGPRLCHMVLGEGLASDQSGLTSWRPHPTPYSPSRWLVTSCGSYSLLWMLKLIFFLVACDSEPSILSQEGFGDKAHNSAGHQCAGRGPRSLGPSQALSACLGREPGTGSVGSEWLATFAENLRPVILWWALPGHSACVGPLPEAP